jgi:DNA-3-methyladenine glycosylase
MNLAWYSRTAQEVAPDLIGCTLVRRIDGADYRGLIVETEAYSHGDPACHGYAGKTDRNASIFGVPGSIYVYLIYGMYHCVNIVTEAEGVCSAVLIRALELDRIPTWISPAEKPERIAAGPGKLCRALKIDRSLDGIQLERNCDLWLEPRHPNFSETIYQTTRIGITKGIELPWRWYLKGHPSVSKV